MFHRLYSVSEAQLWLVLSFSWKDSRWWLDLQIPSHNYRKKKKNEITHTCIRHTLQISLLNLPFLLSNGKTKRGKCVCIYIYTHIRFKLWLCSRFQLTASWECRTREATWACGSLPFTWQTQTEVQPADFSLVQPLLPQAFGKWIKGWRLNLSIPVIWLFK